MGFYTSPPTMPLACPPRDVGETPTAYGRAGGTEAFERHFLDATSSSPCEATPDCRPGRSCHALCPLASRCRVLAPGGQAPDDRRAAPESSPAVLGQRCQARAGGDSGSPHGHAVAALRAPAAGGCAYPDGRCELEGPDGARWRGR